MNNQLTNMVSAIGTYNNLPTSITSEAVVVSMISGLTITKTADKQSWADGNLTYTITIKNDATEAYATPVVTDIIDNTLVNFVEDSVYINGTKAETSQYKYDSTAHSLTINLTDIAPSTTAVATFQVTKKV